MSYQVIYDKEQKGPVSALTHCAGYLVSAIGQKVCTETGLSFALTYLTDLQRSPVKDTHCHLILTPFVLKCMLSCAFFDQKKEISACHSWNTVLTLGTLTVIMLDHASCRFFQIQSRASSSYKFGMVWVTLLLNLRSHCWKYLFLWSYLYIGVGFSFQIFMWTLKDSDLVGIAFIDTHIYIHQLVTIKSLIFAADVQKSVTLYRYQEEERVLSQVCRVCACTFFLSLPTRKLHDTK